MSADPHTPHSGERLVLPSRNVVELLRHLSIGENSWECGYVGADRVLPPGAWVSQSGVIAPGLADSTWEASVTT